MESEHNCNKDQNKLDAPKCDTIFAPSVISKYIQDTRQFYCLWAEMYGQNILVSPINSLLWDLE